jgi:hypothetical protein
VIDAPRNAANGSMIQEPVQSQLQFPPIPSTVNFKPLLTKLLKKITLPRCSVTHGFQLQCSWEHDCCGAKLGADDKLSFSDNSITTFLIFMTKKESAQNGYLIIGLVQKRTQADQSNNHLCVVSSLILLSFYKCWAETFEKALIVAIKMQAPKALECLKNLATEISIILYTDIDVHRRH